MTGRFLRPELQMPVCAWLWQSLTGAMAMASPKNSSSNPWKALLPRALLLVALLNGVGCGDSDGRKLAEAGGVVKYKGQPVATATVMFIPETGSPAMAETDDKGRFSFNTQGKPGATVGPGKITITAVRQLREVSDEEMEKIGGAALDSLMASLRKSVIPEKYNNPHTSGLTVIVTEDPEKNGFTFDLK
jgi:hypothetical protein